MLDSEIGDRANHKPNSDRPAGLAKLFGCERCEVVSGCLSSVVTEAFLRASKCGYVGQIMTDGSRYPQLRSRIHFVIVDLRSVAPGQEALVSRYYP